MIGDKVKTIFRLAFAEFGCLLRSTRMLLLLCTCVFIHTLVIQPMKNCCVLMKGKVSIFEPIVAVGNNSVSAILLPICFLIVMSGFPGNDETEKSVHIRSGRTMWIVAQTLYAFLSSLFFMIFYLLFTIIAIFPDGKISFDFERTMTHLLTEFPEKYDTYESMLIPANLYNQMSLRTALLRTFILFIGFYMMLAMVIMFFSMLNLKKIGILVCGMLICLGTISCAMRAGWMWAFPTANSISWLHYQEFFGKEIYPMYASYLYFAGCSIVLFIMSLVAGKRYQCF